MKLNNKGFGMKETLIYLAVLLLMLLIASCSVMSFYDDLETSKENEREHYENEENNNTNNNVVIVDDEDNINIDYKQYYNAEKKFETAVRDYALKNGFGLTLNTVTLEEVVKSGSLADPIVDYIDGSKCTGYANVYYQNADYQVSVYLLCTNYKTEGYR